MTTFLHVSETQWVKKMLSDAQNEKHIQENKYLENMQKNL
jgi:hypothetical protein